MKNWITSQLIRIKGVNIRKTTSKVVIVAMLANILSPILTYAAILPDFSNALTHPNVPAVAQVSDVVLPRDFVLGDHIQISLSGALTGNKSYIVDFSGSHLQTADALSNLIDAESDYISAYDDSIKTITVSSENPGIPFTIGSLSTTRTPIGNIDTVMNVVAVAQESELTIPQQLIAGDILAFSIDGIAINQAFTVDKDTTLQAFADNITALTNASGSYDNTTSKVTMKAKTPGIAFNMGSLQITSSGISPTVVQPNIVPVKQVDIVNFPRQLYSDENITLNLSGSVIHQGFNTDYATTLGTLALQVNNLPFVDSVYTGGVLSITSSTPGVPFSAANISITGGTMVGVTTIQNQIAIAQEDMIVVPRNVFMGDSINLTISGTTLSQPFNATSANTISLLMAQIDALPNVGVSSYIPAVRAITIKSKNPGFPFPHPTLFISSDFSSTNQIAGQAPVNQISKYNFPRNLVAGDVISTIVNGSPYSVDYSFGSNQTVQSLADLISTSLSGTLNVANTTNQITLTANIAGIPFTTQPLQIVNTLVPTVIVANQVPVKQRELITFPNSIVAGDSISLSIDGNLITQNFVTDEASTLTALNGQIDGLASVSSSANTATKTLTVDAANAGTSFVITDVVTTSNAITSAPVIPNQTGIKASAIINIAGAIIPSNAYKVGDCNVSFTFSGGAYDFDCADNNAMIDTFSINQDDLAHLISTIYNVTDTTASGSRLLSSTASGSEITYITVGSEISTTPIAFDFSAITNGNVVLVSNNSPSVDIAQSSTLTLPRDFVQGDTFQTNINGITVTQNFLTDSNTSFNNLVSQIDSLPNINASGTGNVITLVSTAPGIPFVIGTSSYINTVSPTLTITSVVAQAQKSEVKFPALFVTGDVIKVVVDGTMVTENFISDSNTTFTNLINNITANTNTTASASGSLGIVFDAKNPGTTFTIDKIEVTNTTAVNHAQPNVSGIAQVNALTVPFAPVAGDNMTMLINATAVNQMFISDAFTTYASLNTKLDSLPEIGSFVDTASGTFTMTSKTPGVPFTASLIATGATINSSVVVPNTDSGAQVDSIVISREIKAGDVLNINIAGHTGSISFNSDKTTTLQDLNNFIDALPEVSSIFDGTSVITVTSSIPGIPFSSGIIEVITTYTSTNQVANVPAQTQIDTIAVPRTLVAGDSLSINIGGISVNNTFTGSDSNTLNNFKDLINSAQTGATASVVGSTMTFTANVPGVPFTIGTGSFQLINSSIGTTTVNNVVAVKQETEFNLPTLVAGDSVFLTVQGNPIVVNYSIDNATTVNQIVSDINSLGLVSATYLSGNTVHMISNTAGVPFLVSLVSIINSTPSNLKVANVVPESQITDFTPSGTIREGVTFRLTLDGTDYDYLTARFDTNAEIIDGIAAIVSTNTGVIVSTGASSVTLTAAVPGVPFAYSSQTLDITAPIITEVINTPEILRSGITSTSNVQINEDGDIYLVLTGTTINTLSDITSAIATGDAFIGTSPALAYTDYNVTVAVGVKDGLYNFVAVDPFGNVSQAIPGWLTVDNTPPPVNISTPSQTVSTDTIVINGTTEANRPVTIAGGIAVVNTTSDGAGAFSGTVTLNQNVSNLIDITATDIAGNVGSGSVIIIHDSITPTPFILNYPAFTNSGSANVGITTESGILAEIFSGSTLMSSGMTDGNGNIVLNTTLDINATNNFHVVVTDAGGNTNSGNISIVQDSIAPNIILNPYQTLIHAASINISGTTEPFSTVTLTNTGFTATVTADNLGAWNANIGLNQTLNAQTVNNIVIDVTDLAGNTSSTGITVTEDSIPNTLIISTPSPLYTQNPALTVTGSTRPNSIVTLVGAASVSPTILDSLGIFSIDTVLNLNSINNITVSSLDQVGNFLTGSIVAVHDDIAPTITVTTPTTPTNNLNISIAGTTEANSVLLITGGSGVFASVSDNAGNFTVPVTLNTGVTNVLDITSTDQAGNVGTGSFTILHDPIVNSLVLNSPALSYTALPTIAFSGTTKANAQVTVTGGSGSLNMTADSVGSFSGIIVLNPNTANIIDVSSIDNTLTTVTGSFTVVHDDIIPILTLTQTGTVATNLPNYVISGTTEANALVSFSAGSTNITASADSTGSFSVTFPLVPNTNNIISGSSSDLAGNTSTGVTVNVIHDNLAPVVSSLNVTSSVTGIVMNVTYNFITNESSTSTFHIGTGSNVVATEIMSGSTLGTVHAGFVPGLIPNTTYYYFIDSVDSLGNVSQTPIATVNFIDNQAPVILAKFINNVTVSGATLDFSFQDAHFNPATLAAGTVVLTDGTNVQNLVPTLTYSNPINTGNVIMSGLTSSTPYNYSITLTDDFGNVVSSTGAFTTSTAITLTGTTITNTGSVTIPTGTGNTTSLSGTTLVIMSDPLTSGLPYGSLTIPGTVTILSGSGWNGTIIAPVLVDPNSLQAATNTEIQPLVSPLNNSTTTYSGSVQQTVFAGGNATLTASGGFYTISVGFNTNQVGQSLRIFNSQDGNSWINNSPDNTCVVSAVNRCTFRATTLGFFSFARIIANTIPLPPSPPSSGGGGGGGGIGASVDSCPDGDFSPSYYDRTCGIPGTSNTGNTNTGNTGNTSTGTTDTDQAATSFILQMKQMNYPTAITIDQKIELWKKIIDQINNKLKDPSVTNAKKALYEAIKLKAQAILDALQKLKENPDKVISGDTDTEDYIPAVEITTDENGNISYFKYIKVEHSVVVRDFPSYRGKIVEYLPRNFRVEVVSIGSLWSKLKLNSGKYAYIRTKFLRNENRQDRGRTASQMVFFDASLQSNVDMRKVKVAKYLNVRKGPGVNNAKKGLLKNGDNVLILDAKTTNGWYEIRWTGGTGWVNSKYISNNEMK